MSRDRRGGARRYLGCEDTPGPGVRVKGQQLKRGRASDWGGGTSESGVRVKGPRLGRSTARRGEPRRGLGATHLGQNVLGKGPVTGRV